jgi:hypothetical protein
MISRIRFDDILWESSDPKMKGRELQKFTKHVNWCASLPVTLSPAILCQEIEKFPEGIAYIKERIATDERFYPDLHGWTHGPYGDLPQVEIEEHLEKAVAWFDKNLGVTPHRWVTPHGANSYAIQAAARRFSLIVEDTKYPVIDQKDADTKLRETRTAKCLDDRVIMVHTWERGLRLLRIARVIEFGDADTAIEETKKELDPKTHGICWRGWND